MKSNELMHGVQLKELMIGEECEKARSALDLRSPINNGKIMDWEDMEKVWQHGFDLLEVNPTESKILMTEAILTPKKDREKVLETMFETYGFTHMYLAVQAVLVLYAQSAQTGIVVDAGDGVTHAVPVWDNMVNTEGVQRLDLAGRNLTKRLVELMVHSGYSMNSSSDFEIARIIKDKYCYVALDPKKESTLCQDTTCQTVTFQLPDRRTITLNEERHLVPEALFNPSKMGHEGLGIADLTFEAINKCALDNRRDLYGKIVLSGGTTMFPGLPTRMQKDLKTAYTERVAEHGRMDINIVAPGHRKHMVFQGGSVLANIFDEAHTAQWITKQEYQEKGAGAMLDEKCQYY
jgi:actin-related protein 2